MTGYIDNFETSKILGEGASSKVRLGFDKQTGERVAIKMLDLEDPRNNARKIELLRKEVEAIQCMNHKHIVKCN